MKKISSYVLRHKKLIFIPSIALIIGVGIDMLNPKIIQVIIDDVLTNHNTKLLAPLLWTLLGIAITRAVLGYIRDFLFDNLGQKVNYDLKKDLFSHIQSLPYKYFDNKNTGELMSRMSEDIDNIWRVVGFGLMLTVEQVIYLIIGTYMIFTLNYKLALISLIPMPFIAWLVFSLEKKEGEVYGKISDQGAIVNTTAQENIAGVRLVKAFAREKYEILKFLKLNNEKYELNMEQSRVLAKHYPAIELLSNFSLVMVVCLGGIFVINKEISVGVLVAFVQYVSMLIQPIRMLGWLANMVAQSKASINKINKIFEVQPEIKDSADSINLPKISGDVKFDNVSFKYNNEMVLKNVSFEAKEGQTVAIMGATGSGKSTIINLIGRYYDVTDGKVEVDGVDVKKICLKDLRSNISIVPQDTFLFSSTIEENIKFGREDASKEEIERYCEKACASEFIDGLENGYDSVVGERGIGLSGGQKQRLSIARAMIKQAPILILDDSTSALDMETEFELLQNINDSAERPTTFIIAHRISAVKNADKILYMENGQVVEDGTHQELINKRGKYYDVYCKQLKQFENIDEVV